MTRKTAERLLLDLQDRLAALTPEEAGSGPAGPCGGPDGMIQP